MSGRDRVLANVRESLNRKAPLPPGVTGALEARLRHPTANLQPAFDAPDLASRFAQKMRAVNGLVTQVDALSDVAGVVATHLSTHRLPERIVVAPDPALAAIPWSNRLAVERRAAGGDDPVSVTGAWAGVAESGTLVLLSGAEHPTTLNFLPDDHIVVLESARIVRYLEDAWARLRSERQGMPRTVNLITGPSKTGDIEQTIYEGAHGPRRLHVILVG